MIFRCGQKVVFIGPEVTLLGIHSGLTLRSVYTVQSIYLAFSSSGWAITLYETLPPEGFKGWDICAFRPAVDRKTDISVFKELLTPVGVT